MNDVKILWISLFTIWCLGMCFISLYLELFMGWNGIITQTTIKYNIQSKESHFQYAMHHWRDDEPVIPIRIKNIKSFKNIIGIGCIKCGTAFFHSQLARHARFWERGNRKSKYHFVFKWEESHYFETCTNCTFGGYLNTLTKAQEHDPLQYRPTNKIWIFGEKTVTYFDNYNTARLVSFYAHRYDMFFYIVLRNPIKQLWSHIWMRTEGCRPDTALHLQCLFIRDEHYYLQRDNEQHVLLMAEYLHHFLSYQVQNELPILYQIMNELQIDPSVNNGSNSDINTAKVMQLLMKRTSDILHYYSHVFISSCHYVLVWLRYNQWNAMNQYQSIAFEDRFRIIQIEQVFQSERVSNEYVQRLMCWMIGYEMKLDECTTHGMIKGKKIKSNADIFHHKLRQYAPDTVDVMDLNVSETIRTFYNDSHQRLIWFIAKHPDIMI
eukprot:1090108_1